MPKTVEKPISGSLSGSINSPYGEALSFSPSQASVAGIANPYDEIKASSEFKYNFSFWLSRIVQGIFYPVFYVAYRIAFSLRINGKENLKDIKGPIIFISNHIGMFDSFIFDLFVPPFTAIPPFRFMGTKKFEILSLNILKYTGIVDVIYKLFGVFEVSYGEGAEKALIPAYDIIKHGGTVAIFPEGKLWRYDRYGTGKGEKEPIGPFKWGAAILAKNTGSVVVPVSFKQHSRNFWRDYLSVNIGKPFYVEGGKSPEVISAEMRERVVGLYWNIN